MSDYLWDKSGEPEAEVKRLEELLGSLRHRPRRLELPAETAPLESLPLEPLQPRLYGAARRFGPAGLAVAATLLLAFLLGVTFFLRTRVTNGVDRAVSLRAARPPQEPKRQESVITKQEPTQARRETETDAGARLDEQVVVRDEQVAVQDLTPELKQGGQLAVVQKRRQKLTTAAAAAGGARSRDGGAFVGMRAESRVGASAGVLESTRLLAKEQLVYALRLTGAKLREVQRKTQGLEDSKRAFDAQERIK
jgi:hypothetical protein